MDLDNPKVYGDTFIYDGLVNILTGHLLYGHGVPTDGKSLGLVGIL